MAWRSYVAVGDSFTEGLDDPHPAGDGYRGWADLVAERLAEGLPEFRYANLAIRGRLFDQIVESQVPLALAARPDLISFAAGGNDALRRSFDGPSMSARIDRVVSRLREGGADLVVFRFADVTRLLPGKRIVLPRAQLMNEAIGAAAERHGARLVDLWADDEFANPAMWSLDRLHLSAYGHRRVAAHVVTTLGIRARPGWWEVPAVPVLPSWPGRRAADLRWVGQHFAPWAKRRLFGRSSGDTREPKRPTLTPVRSLQG